MYQCTLQTGVKIGVWCPTDAPPEGWSLRTLQRQEDVKRNEHLTRGVREALRKMGVYKAYAPHIAPASARIVDTRALNERIDLGEGFILQRNNLLPADGLFVGKGYAFVMSSWGCPVIIATADEQMIVAHAGRDSLIDRGAVVGEPTRKHVSVVDAIIEAFSERGIPPSKIAMNMNFAVPAAAFGHRLDDECPGAPYNRALLTFVRERWPLAAVSTDEKMFLDLGCLCEEQAFRAGVQNVWATNSLSEFPALAHTHDGKGADRRNLFIVKRNSN